MRPEVKKYLIEQCRDCMLKAEIKALGRFGLTEHGELNARKTALAEHKMELVYGFKNEKVNKLVSLGEKIATEKIANRILVENPNILNYCSSCNKLTRTPRAKQCRYCGNRWF